MFTDQICNFSLFVCIFHTIKDDLVTLLNRGVVVNFYLPERSSCKSNLMHFRLKIMTSGGNNFNNFSENQLVKFRV